MGIPPAAIDQAGIADQRLKGMWGAQRFHGPAPGKQTGSMGCDDYRNPRLPLPSRPGAGWSIGGGGMWCGPALVPRGIDPGLLGLPGGGGGAPLLGNNGLEDWISFFGWLFNHNQDTPKAAPYGHSTTVEKDESNGGTGGGGNGNTRTYTDVDVAAYEQAEMPWYEGLDDLADGVNWLYDHSLGWLANQAVGAVGKNKWGAEALQWTGNAAVTAQNYIDEQGAQVFGTTQWNNFRSVMNFDNKYVQAVSNTVDFVTLFAGAAGAVKSLGGAGLKDGLGAVLKTGLRESGEEALERAAIIAVKEEAVSAFTRSMAKTIPEEALGDVVVYLAYERGNPNPVYVGITNDINRRAAEHVARFAYLEAVTPGLKRNYARGVEQVLIERNAGFQNKINSISTMNQIYSDMTNFGRWYLDE